MKLLAHDYSKRSLVSLQALNKCGQRYQNQMLDELSVESTSQLCKDDKDKLVNRKGHQTGVALTRELHELLFNFQEQLESFENQKHRVYENFVSKQKALVTQVDHLANIDRLIPAVEHDLACFWILQGTMLRKVNAQSMKLVREISLPISE